MGLYLRRHNKLILIEIKKVYIALNGQDSVKFVGTEC